MEIAKEPVISQKMNFPEFENYEIFEGKLNVEKRPGALTQAFRYVGSGLGSLGSFFSSKYEEYNIGSKLKEGGSASLKGLSNAGSYLYNLTKPLVKYASDKATEGVGYLYKKMSENNNNNNNTNQEDEKEEVIRIERDDMFDEENYNISNGDNEEQKSDIIFKKSEEIPDKEENKEIERGDYPTYSEIKLVQLEEEEENNNIDNSAAPL